MMGSRFRLSCCTIFCLVVASALSSSPFSVANPSSYKGKAPCGNHARGDSLRQRPSLAPTLLLHIGTAHSTSCTCPQALGRVPLIVGCEHLLEQGGLPAVELRS